MDLVDQVVSLAFDLAESALFFVIFRRAGFSGAWLAVPCVPVMLWVFWTVYNAAILPLLIDDSIFSSPAFYYIMRTFWLAPLVVLTAFSWPKLGAKA